MTSGYGLDMVLQRLSEDVTHVSDRNYFSVKGTWSPPPTQSTLLIP